jgi:xRRM domain
MHEPGYLCYQCHVRLSQPALTTQLRDYFATHRVYQTTGLDSAGATMSDTDGASKSIQVEIIQGRKEELYWAKVPDKVRATALLKIYQMGGEEKGVNPGHDKKRRRKR